MICQSPTYCFLDSGRSPHDSHYNAIKCVGTLKTRGLESIHKKAWQVKPVTCNSLVCWNPFKCLCTKIIYTIILSTLCSEMHSCLAWDCERTHNFMKACCIGPQSRSNQLCSKIFRVRSSSTACLRWPSDSESICPISTQRRGHFWSG